MHKTFSERVIEAALSIPPGKIATYGDVARVCGGGGQAARSVTGILSRAYQNGEKNIPWHRIVYSDGRIWSTPKYEKRRRELYKKEGIEVDEKGYIKDFHSIRHAF